VAVAVSYDPDSRTPGEQLSSDLRTPTLQILPLDLITRCLKPESE
jgi:hypothetical protein